MTQIAKPKPPSAVNGNSVDLGFIEGKVSLFIDDNEYRIDGKSLHNTSLVLKHHPAMRGKLVYNLFADDIFLRGCPPWEDEQRFNVHPWREEDTTSMRMWLEQNGIKTSKNDAHDVMITTAKANVINPPKDYFESLKWDGTLRLNKWLEYYLGCTTNNEEYLELVGAKWMIGIVSRIYNPGNKFDTALLLEGAENKGKSSALACLARIGGQSYFTDEHIDFQGKDSAMVLQGKLIYEMSELANWRTASSEKVKSWVSRCIDMYRPPYAKKPIERPRMFCLAGSLNPSGGLFKDSTGNRRYWIALVGNIKLEELERDREQLWAEAVHRYRLKERIWLIDNEFELARIEQDMRFDEDILAQKIEDTIMDIDYNGSGFSLEEIIEKWGMPLEKRSNQLKNRISGHLTSIGYELARPRLAGKRPRLWMKKDPEQTSLKLL